MSSHPEIAPDLAVMNKNRDDYFKFMDGVEPLLTDDSVFLLVSGRYLMDGTEDRVSICVQHVLTFCRSS